MNVTGYASIRPEAEICAGSIRPTKYRRALLLLGLIPCARGQPLIAAFKDMVCTNAMGDGFTGCAVRGCSDVGWVGQTRRLSSIGNRHVLLPTCIVSKPDFDACARCHDALAREPERQREHTRRHLTQDLTPAGTDGIAHHQYRTFDTPNRKRECSHLRSAAVHLPSAPRG